MKIHRTTIVFAVVIIFFLLWYWFASIAGGMEDFFYYLMLVLFPTAISILLIYSSKKGFVFLWSVVLAIALVGAIAGLGVDFIPLLSTDCGPECGAGVGVEPFAISIAAVVAGIIYSIPPLRQRRGLQMLIAFVLMSFVFSFGLPVWVS